MTDAVQEFLNSFDRLAELEQQIAVSELLKRTVEANLPPLDDETFDLLAEELFLELDAEESANG